MKASFADEFILGATPPSFPKLVFDWVDFKGQIFPSLQEKGWDQTVKSAHFLLKHT